MPVPYESSFARRGLYLEAHGISRMVAAAVDATAEEQHPAPLSRIAELLAGEGERTLTGYAHRLEQQIDYLLQVRSTLEYQLDCEKREKEGLQKSLMRRLAETESELKVYKEKSESLETRDEQLLGETALRPPPQTAALETEDANTDPAASFTVAESPRVAKSWEEERRQLLAEIERLRAAHDTDAGKQQGGDVPTTETDTLADHKREPAEALDSPTFPANEAERWPADVASPLPALGVPESLATPRPINFVVIGHARVLVSFTAENEDELSVREGDHISVLHPAQATPRGYVDMARLGGWLYAMDEGGSEGLVPEDCIEVQEAVGD